jgi:tRNA dimethylallyltransferase
VIAGPTATGKTEAAVRVAEHVGGEIISADSMQIYRELEAGTAKPTPEERARAVFHLVDFVDPREPYSAADFQRDAHEAIAGVHARGKLPILCGGTGLYIRAVLGGLSFPPGATPVTQEIRERLEAEADRLGLAALHKRLAQVDPASAERLPPADRRRVIRALEVYEHTGTPFSALARVDAAAQVHYNAATYVLTCPRSLLYQRIDSRVETMLAGGWLQEVVSLRESGLTTAHQAMQAIGYRHLLNYLEVDGDFGHLIELIKRDTRRFAKRQLTWFRRDESQWLEWGTPQEYTRTVEQLCAAAELLTNPTPDR